MQKDILIVEDESAIREMVSFALGNESYLLREAEDSDSAKNQIANKVPDLILLDWMLPGVDGIDFARQLKKDELTREIPIIMLTARGEQENKVKGLEAGVDDYVTKPFLPKELRLRIQAVLRRASPGGETGYLEINGLALDGAAHRVYSNGREVPLGPTEYRLLHFFMSHPDRVYTRGQLLDRVWGRSAYIEERTVDVHIRRLRKALSPYKHDCMLQTVRGTGYRFSGTT